MIVRSLAAVAIAAALAATSPAFAAGSSTDQSPYASMALYLITPHEARSTTDDKRFDAAVEQNRRQKLAEWAEAHSRAVYPGYGVSNVHGPSPR